MPQEEVFVPPDEDDDNNKPQILRGPTNVTAFLGDRVELRCQVSGKPSPTVLWFSRREGELPSLGANFRVHKNNSLIFRRIDKRDESYYHCLAKNSRGATQSPPARVTVEGNFFGSFLGQSERCFKMQMKQLELRNHIFEYNSFQFSHIKRILCKVKPFENAIPIHVLS